MTRHAIPTGLAVEDRFIAYGAYTLSLRQFLTLVAGVTVGYGLWKDHPALAPPARAALTAIVVAVAALVALLRPAGRPLEQWLFVLGRYRRTARPAVWRPRAPHPDARRGANADLVVLTPPRRWGHGELPPAPAAGREREESR